MSNQHILFAYFKPTSGTRLIIRSVMEIMSKYKQRMYCILPWECLNVTQQLNLIKLVSAQEIKPAMYFNCSFLKGNWHIVRKTVTKASCTRVLWVWRLSCATLKFPVLMMDEFRLISCCNIIYKCISIVLHARLKDVMAHLAIKVRVLL